MLPEKVVEKVRKSKASTSVRRIGVTLGLKLNHVHGISPYVGSWLVYFSNKRIPHEMLPYAAYLPAVAATLVFDAIKIDSNNISNINYFPIEKVDSINRGISFWHILIMEWISRKTVAVGVNMGIYSSSHGLLLKSNAMCDMFPFIFPLGKIVAAIILMIPLFVYDLIRLITNTLLKNSIALRRRKYGILNDLQESNKSVISVSFDDDPVENSLYAYNGVAI